MRHSKKRIFSVPAVFLAACVTLAACGSSGGGSASSGSSGSSGASGGSQAGGLKTGLSAYVIPKLLGAQYFTVADTAKFGGAIAALQQLGETGTETSGTAATPASEIPAIQAAITKGANILIVSATDPTALCPTLQSAMSKGITVVTYDSDAPTCRNLFVNQADTTAIGVKQVDLDRQGDSWQRRHRHRLGRGLGHEPERLDRGHEAGAEEVPEGPPGGHGVR